MVDQIGIKVWPDSRGFRDDLKKSLERVEKQLKAVIPATINFKRSTLADLRRQLKSINVDVPVGIDTTQVREAAREAREAAQRASERDPVEIPATIGDLDKRFIARLRRDAQKAADAAEATIPATIEGENLRKDLSRQLERLESQLRATIPVEPERAAAWRSELQRMVDDINDQKAEIPANVDLDRGAARAQLAALLRPRTIPINLSVTKASIAGVGAAIAGIAGLRVLGDVGSSVKRVITNLDRITAKAAALAPALLNIGAAALAGTSNLLALGASLASIAPAVLALPGIFAGFGIGLGVMIAALKDAGTVLKDLGPAFTDLQDTISSNFWAVAEGPIRKLVQTWLPSLRSGLGAIATQLGSFFGSMSNALASTQNVALLDGILASIARAIDIAAEGIAYFVDGLMGLVSVGASYLPQMAGWFNDISERFSEWVALNTSNGNLFAWIDAGVLALQDLGRVLGGVGGVLGGFARAAANAGGASLGALADGLDRLNTVVNGPAFQGALTTVFQGAHDAMAALGPGVSALGDAFVALAPTLAQIMVLAGEIGSVALTAIADAFSNPVFQGGLAAFFQGVLEGATALAPHIPALAEAFGSVAAFAGTLASVLGPVLGAAFEALGPVVTDIVDGLSALAPVLGGALVTAIQALAPFIQQIVDSIVLWIGENPQLASTIGVIVVAIGGLIAGAVSLVGALLPVITAIIGIAGPIMTAVTAAGGFSAVLASVGAALAAVAAPIALVVAGVAAIVAALVYAWTTSEAFRTAIAGLGQALLGFFQPIIAFVQGTVLPVLMQVGQAILGALQAVGAALTPLLTVVIEIVTQIIAYLTPLVSFILDVLSPVFTFLGTVVSSVFSQLGTIIAGAIDIITAILQTFLAVIQGDWAGAWEGIKAIGSAVWQFLLSLITTSITHVQTVIQAGLSMVQGIWSAVWSRIGGVLTSVWSRITSAVSSGLAAIRGFFTRILSAIVSFVISRIAAIRLGFSNGLNAARDIVARVLATIRARFLQVLVAIVSFVVSRIAAIRQGFSNGLNAVRSLVSSVLSAIRSRFASILAAVVALVSSRIAAIVGFFRALPGRITGALSSLAGRLRTMGVQMMQGMVNGIKSMAGRLLSAARETVSGAINGAKSLLGIHSPSKVFMEIGEYTGEGMIIGLEHRARAVNAAMTDMVTPPTAGDVGTPGGPMPGTAGGSEDLAAQMAQLLAVLSQWEPVDERGFLMMQRRAGRQAAR